MGIFQFLNPYCKFQKTKFKMKFLCVLVFIAIAATQTSGLSIQPPPLVGSTCGSSYIPTNCGPIVVPVGGCTYTPQTCYRRVIRRRTRCYRRRSYGGCGGTYSGCSTPINYC